MKVVFFTFAAIASIFISSANGFLVESKPTACVCPAPTVVQKPVYYCPQTNPPTNGGYYPPPTNGGYYPPPTNGGYYPPPSTGGQVKNCYYADCSTTPNLTSACGALNGQCKLYTCVSDLYNENCSKDSKIEYVNMKYCEGKSVGGAFSKCTNYP